jgi:hypothetical protein
MTRYFTAPRADWDDDAKALDHLARTVHEPEPKPRDTGLLDAAGKKLWAMDDRQPIGFVRFAGDC